MTERAAVPWFASECAAEEANSTTVCGDPDSGPATASNSSIASAINSQVRQLNSWLGIGSTGSACTAPIAAYGSMPDRIDDGCGDASNRSQERFRLVRARDTGEPDRHGEATGQRWWNLRQRRQLQQGHRGGCVLG